MSRGGESDVQVAERYVTIASGKSNDLLQTDGVTKEIEPGKIHVYLPFNVIPLNLYFDNFKLLTCEM